MEKLTERQLFLLQKAIQYIDKVSEYSFDIDITGYDEVDFDAKMLIDDLKIDFNLQPHH